MDISLSTPCARPTRRHGVVALLATRFDIWRERRALARLDAAARRDLGLSLDDVRRESERHLWDVPGHWRL